MVARISIGTGRQENFAQMVERYKGLAQPQVIHTGLIFFTISQDLKLYNMLVTDKAHPIDTGLLKQKWVRPAIKTGNNVTDLQFTPDIRKYVGSFASGVYNVYVLNEATIGEQQKLKYAKENWGHFKKKKVRGSYKLKRYLKYVDKRTDFYSSKLRIIRQGLNAEWKNFVPNYLLRRFDIIR